MLTRIEKTCPVHGDEMGKPKIRPEIRTTFFIVACGIACIPCDTYADGTFRAGVEAFHDHYREPNYAGNVDENSDYGSVTASYSHTYEGYFGALEARGSYGRDDYKSPSGLITNIPQYEAEARLLGGITTPINDDVVIIPFIGVGSRYFYDQNKGHVTNIGLYGYDRRITQYYLPLGVTTELTSDGWIYRPTIEVDKLLYGSVKTRLAEIPGLYDIYNKQRRGYGWRGEFMVGQHYDSYGWEVGPFFRYWNIKQSQTTVDPSGTPWIEPDNNRFQAGASLRLTY